jgi:hypothetical protein
MARVLIAGASTRAAAESAARAGFEVTALDAYADLDQHPSVRAVSIPRDLDKPFSPRAGAEAARAFDADAVVYLSSFENDPDAVARLAEGRCLWGNPPDVLRRVRDPFELAEALDRRGLAPLTVRGQGPGPEHRDGRRWLIKPRASGGGHGITRWEPGARVQPDRYLQEFATGTAGSIIFVSAGRRMAALGLSRQLIGDRAFGASGFRYCGSIFAAGSFERGGDLLSRARLVAAGIVEAFGLVGVGSIDFVAADGVPRVVEVNPRWSASMELVERAHGLSVFSAHVAACVRGELLQFDVEEGASITRGQGKAVLFARHGLVIGDTSPWLADGGVRDVPHAGEHMAAGQPVCTVFAEGPDDSACYRALVERAERVYADLERWRCA